MTTQRDAQRGIGALSATIFQRARGGASWAATGLATQAGRATLLLALCALPAAMAQTVNEYEERLPQIQAGRTVGRLGAACRCCAAAFHWGHISYLWPEGGGVGKLLRRPQIIEMRQLVRAALWGLRAAKGELQMELFVFQVMQSKMLQLPVL